MFDKIQVEIATYLAVFEICWDISFFFCLFWHEMLQNGTIAYPCEQVPKLVW